MFALSPHPVSHRRRTKSVDNLHPLGRYLILRGRDNSAEALAPAVQIFETYEAAQTEAEKRVTKQAPIYICQVTAITLIEEIKMTKTTTADK
jgi:hypothetical protein